MKVVVVHPGEPVDWSQVDRDTYFMGEAGAANLYRALAAKERYVVTTSAHDVSVPPLEATKPNRAQRRQAARGRR